MELKSTTKSKCKQLIIYKWHVYTTSIVGSTESHSMISRHLTRYSCLHRWTGWCNAL